MNENVTPAIVAADPAGLEAAALAIKAGSAVVVPTDTVYGVAALANDAPAIDRLFELKRRPTDRAIAVLVADVGQAYQLAELTDDEAALAQRHWPGALTIVLQRRADVDPGLGRDDGTIGLRCPADPFVRRLAERVGPLATTSANRSGEATPENALDATATLDGSIAVVVDDGPRAGQASTVVKLVGHEILILRAGPLTTSDLRTN